MKVTLATVRRVLSNAIADQEKRLVGYVEKEDWRNAAECDAYLRGMRFSIELVDMLRIEEDE